MQVTHEPWLVALSLIVAIQGAYVGLSLAVQVGGQPGCAGGCCSRAPPSRSRSRSGRCISSACWRRGCRSRSTTWSFPRCCRSWSALSWWAPRSSRSAPGRRPACGLPRPRPRWAAASSSMHYIGMSALHASAHMHHAVFFVVASIVGRDRRVRPGALARGRTWRAAAAAALGDRARCRDLGHALHRDGRA